MPALCGCGLQGSSPLCHPLTPRTWAAACFLKALLSGDQLSPHLISGLVSAPSTCWWKAAAAFLLRTVTPRDSSGALPPSQYVLQGTPRHRNGTSRSAGGNLGILKFPCALIHHPHWHYRYFGLTQKRGAKEIKMLLSMPAGRSAVCKAWTQEVQVSLGVLYIKIRENRNLNKFIIWALVRWALQLIFPFSRLSPSLLDLCYTAHFLIETPQISLSPAAAVVIWVCLWTEICYWCLKKNGLLNVREYVKLCHEKRRKYLDKIFFFE